MSMEIEGPEWKEVIEILKKYNIDFDQRIKDLIPAKIKTVPGPPTRPAAKSVISMKMVVEDE